MKNKLKKAGIIGALGLAGLVGYYINDYKAPEKKFLIKKETVEGVYKYPSGPMVYERHEHEYKVLPKQKPTPAATPTPKPYKRPTPTQKERREGPKEASIDDYWQEKS